MTIEQLDYQIIQTANGQTGYVTLGTGHALIMLVGYSGNLLHWNSELIYALAEKFTLYLPDNRLVGQTNSTNPSSMAGLAADSLDFIQALGLKKPLICGWSMGGIIAQALAYQQQDLIGGLIFIVSQPDYSFTLGRLHQLVSNLREKPNKENRERLTEVFFSGVPSLELRKYLAKAILPIKHYVYPFNEHAQALQDTAVATWNSDHDQLRQINLPSLISVAKNDWVTDPKASLILHELIPNSKLISYPDGGHFFLHRYPRQLAQEICQFFLTND